MNCIYQHHFYGDPNVLYETGGVIVNFFLKLHPILKGGSLYTSRAKK